ncbi:CTI6 (YPL181W) [Zygosaccharomyces parabailii]|nr:CTI6 (YPL181W) [Zygosaccharomyces parabailii]CDH10267.1 related to Histone deacetylase complex subunit CTI6 [Zygosaccharomyces bailii ISA1307]
MTDTGIEHADHKEDTKEGPGQEVAPEALTETPLESQDNEGGDEEGETRCICKELDPPDDSGLYIQCEQCGVWQHGLCVGISDGEDSYLEKYWCEQCKPELHHLYTIDTAGTLRSVYQPIQEKRKRVRRNSRQRAGSAHGSQADDSHLSSSNSSIQDATEQNSAEDRKEGRSKSSKLKREQGQSSISSNPPTKDGNLKTEPLLHPQLPEDAEEDAEEDDKKLQDRKRATFLAREEKHYQWMLEKAIRESRRTSRQDEDQQLVEEEAGYGFEDAGAEQPAKGQEHTIRKSVGSGGGSPIERNDNQEQSGDLQSEQGNSTHIVGNINATQAKEGLPVSRSGSTNSTSEDDSKKPKKTKRNSQRNNRSAGNGGSRNGGSPSGKLEVGINKPMKPRLPSQRTSLNEMRRRVAAILEFISRTQWELSEEQSSRDELVRFVENQQFVRQVDTIFESHDQTLKMMDELTRSLLLWEKKYSHGTSPQG